MAVQLIGGRKVITRENPIFTDRLTNYSDRQSILHIAGQGYDPAEHVSATEAFRRQGLLDLHYEKQPLYITVNGTQMPTDLFAIVETNGAGTQRVIGDPVAKGYHLIQNADLAAGLDRFTARHDLDAVATMHSGTLIMTSVRFGDIYEVNGEPHTPYLRVTNGVGGMHALRVSFTHIRLHCTNTLHAAWSGTNGVSRWSFKHKVNVEEDFTAVISLEEAMREASQRMQDEIRQMSRVRISPDDAKRIFLTAWATPKKGSRLLGAEAYAAHHQVQAVQLGNTWTSAADEYARQVERHRMLMAQLEIQYQQFNSEYPQSANTPYAAYQTVAEMVDASVSESDGNLAYSVLEGAGYTRVTAAYRAAATFAGIEN